MIESKIVFKLILNSDKVIVLLLHGIGIEGNLIDVLWRDDHATDDVRALERLVLEYLQRQRYNLFTMCRIDVAGGKLTLLYGINALAR